LGNFIIKSQKGVLDAQVLKEEKKYLTRDIARQKKETNDI
jgi:hypothetical protein